LVDCDFTLAYQFSAFSIETQNTKHLTDRLNTSFCWNETKIKCWRPN